MGVICHVCSSYNRPHAYRRIHAVDYDNIIQCFISASRENLARNKPAIQKSDYSFTYVAGKAVDGDSTTYSCTTTSMNYPYWSVDLGFNTSVHHLYITSVSDRNGEFYLLLIQIQ